MRDAVVEKSIHKSQGGAEKCDANPLFARPGMKLRARYHHQDRTRHEKANRRCTPGAGVREELDG